jgi:hypothetical protein
VGKERYRKAYTRERDEFILKPSLERMGEKENGKPL